VDLSSGHGVNDPGQISLADRPPTTQQTQLTLAIAIVLLVGFAALPSFSVETLPLAPDFIPALDAVIFVTTFITAVLLAVQFAITRSRPLLVLAGGFLFACILNEAHEWAFRFANGHATETTTTLYFWWMFVVPVTVIIYARLRGGGHVGISSHTSTVTHTVIGVMGALVLTGCVAWLAEGLAPRPFWGGVIEWLVYVAAFLSLWVARRSAFDQWIMVALIPLAISETTTIMPHFAVLIRELQAHHEMGINFPIDAYHRTPVGFYALKASSAVSSTLLLAALIAETATLYAEAARVNALTISVSVSQALSSEIALPNLIERLMTVVLRYSGADRGLLILPRQNDHVVAAEARAQGAGVSLNCDASHSPSLPELVISYVSRTQTTVILDDAAKQNLFSEDPYLELHAPRSILCLPLVRQGVLRGVIYLENSLAPKVFTSERVRLLELLAAQAAISLENARLYADLELQVGLLQQLPVAAWTLKPDGMPDFVNQVWLEFSGQTLEFIRSHPEAWMAAVHPEDREMAAKSFWEGVHSGQGFAFETRTLRAKDGTYRRHLQQAVVLRDAEGKVLKFVGTTTDIDDQKRAEETLRQAQSDLAHVARVATLNAMAASIAHEVNQPLSGILTNANTGLRMLAAEPPNLAGVAETVRRTVRDANRASGVIQRLREMFSNRAPITELVDLNNAARDVIAISVGELQRRRVHLQSELADGLPPVKADRVQLQPVILNLLLNAADAMDGIEGRPRTLLVRTEPENDGAVRLDVRDAGTGFDPATVEKLFEAFHTTKANGMGVGLAICRSIIDSHKGRLWATPNDGPGATFSFSIPVATEPADAPSQPGALGMSA
jgi:PAS domain S-box-containing protein